MADTKVYARHFQTLTKIVGDADPSDQKSTAKDKLAKLSAQQFSELSTDVYDEVVRREVKDFPFLPVDVQFHPKRNQARQKLATLQLARFQELCRDVKWEIEQRFPEIGKISQGSLQNLAASAPLSNLAVKGLKGKEDSVRSNDSLNLMGSNHQLAPNVPNEIARKDGEIAKLKRELNDSRQQNLKLESALNAKSNECSELKADYDNQVSVIRSLDADLDVVNERVKQLTADLEKTKAQEATALARIKELEEANQILTRNLQRDKEAFNYSQRSITSKDRIPTAKNGTKSDIPAPTINMISDEVYSAIYSKDDILPYTNAIDRLLEESRKQRGPSPNILIAMKAVVIACKSITQVCENFENEQELPYPDAQDIEDSKLQLSESLTTLMAIVKDLSVKDPDSSSVERIYNAACDLTSVVINLVKTINSIAEQEDEEPNQPPSTQSRNTLRYSIPELKLYLETQTDKVVQSIQALLEHLRKQEPPEELNQVVNNIQDVVFSLLTKSRETLTNERGNVKDQGLETLDELERANRKLDNAVDTLYRTPTKICKQNVASSAYEIAMVYLINKLVKQTISLLEQQ